MVAYADPPYLGMCARYGHEHGDGGCWDDLGTHGLLVDRLCAEYTDGWAMSLTSPSLRVILPFCPDDARVAAWVKPFASFKPGVNPGYCWEPVIFRGGRRRTDRTELTVRDFLDEPIQLRKGFFGAKPFRFNQWVRDLLGVRDSIDTLVDLFPGSGSMAIAEAHQRFVFGTPA